MTRWRRRGRSRRAAAACNKARRAGGSERAATGRRSTELARQQGAGPGVRIILLCAGWAFVILFRGRVFFNPAFLTHAFGLRAGPFERALATNAPHTHGGSDTLTCESCLSPGHQQAIDSMLLRRKWDRHPSQSE